MHFVASTHRCFFNCELFSEWQSVVSRKRKEGEEGRCSLSFSLFPSFCVVCAACVWNIEIEVPVTGRHACTHAHTLRHYSAAMACWLPPAGWLHCVGCLHNRLSSLAHSVGTRLYPRPSPPFSSLMLPCSCATALLCCRRCYSMLMQAFHPTYQNMCARSRRRKHVACRFITPSLSCLWKEMREKKEKEKERRDMFGGSF